LPLSEPAKAGNSIKPGLKRGSASEPHVKGVKQFQPAKRAADAHRFETVAHFAGSHTLFATGTRVPLAKHRSTLGYMLLPASQAQNQSIHLTDTR